MHQSNNQNHQDNPKTTLLLKEAIASSWGAGGNTQVSLKRPLWLRKQLEREHEVDENIRTGRFRLMKENIPEAERLERLSEMRKLMHQQSSAQGKTNTTTTRVKTLNVDALLYGNSESKKKKKRANEAALDGDEHNDRHLPNETDEQNNNNDSSTKGTTKPTTHNVPVNTTLSSSNAEKLSLMHSAVSSFRMAKTLMHKNDDDDDDAQSDDTETKEAAAEAERQRQEAQRAETLNSDLLSPLSRERPRLKAVQFVSHFSKNFDLADNSNTNASSATPRRGRETTSPLHQNHRSSSSPKNVLDDNGIFISTLHQQDPRRFSPRSVARNRKRLLEQMMKKNQRGASKHLLKNNTTNDNNNSNVDLSVSLSHLDGPISSASSPTKKTSRKTTENSTNNNSLGSPELGFLPRKFIRALKEWLARARERITDRRCAPLVEWFQAKKEREHKKSIFTSWNTMIYAIGYFRRAQMRQCFWALAENAAEEKALFVKQRETTERVMMKYKLKRMMCVWHRMCVLNSVWRKSASELRVKQAVDKMLKERNHSEFTEMAKDLIDVGPSQNALKAAARALPATRQYLIKVMAAWRGVVKQEKKERADLVLLDQWFSTNVERGQRKKSGGLVGTKEVFNRWIRHWHKCIASRYAIHLMEKTAFNAWHGKFRQNYRELDQVRACEEKVHDKLVGKCFFKWQNKFDENKALDLLSFHRLTKNRLMLLPFMLRMMNKDDDRRIHLIDAMKKWKFFIRGRRTWCIFVAQQNIEYEVALKRRAFAVWRNTKEHTVVNWNSGHMRNFLLQQQQNQNQTQSSSNTSRFGGNNNNQSINQFVFPVDQQTQQHDNYNYNSSNEESTRSAAAVTMMIPRRPSLQQQQQQQQSKSLRRLSIQSKTTSMANSDSQQQLDEMILGGTNTTNMTSISQQQHQYNKRERSRSQTSFAGGGRSITTHPVIRPSVPSLASITTRQNHQDSVHNSNITNNENNNNNTATDGNESSGKPQEVPDNNNNSTIRSSSSQATGSSPQRGGSSANKYQQHQQQQRSTPAAAGATMVTSHSYHHHSHSHSHHHHTTINLPRHQGGPSVGSQSFGGRNWTLNPPVNFNLLRSRAGHILKLDQLESIPSPLNLVSVVASPSDVLPAGAERPTSATLDEIHRMAHLPLKTLRRHVDDLLFGDFLAIEGFHRFLSCRVAQGCFMHYVMNESAQSTRSTLKFRDENLQKDAIRQIVDRLVTAEKNANKPTKEDELQEQMNDFASSGSFENNKNSSSIFSANAAKDPRKLLKHMQKYGGSSNINRNNNNNNENGEEHGAEEETTSYSMVDKALALSNVFDVMLTTTTTTKNTNTNTTSSAAHIQNAFGENNDKNQTFLPSFPLPPPTTTAWNITHRERARQEFQQKQIAEKLIRAKAARRAKLEEVCVQIKQELPHGAFVGKTPIVNHLSEYVMSSVYSARIDNIKRSMLDYISKTRNNAIQDVVGSVNVREDRRTSVYFQSSTADSENLISLLSTDENDDRDNTTTKATNAMMKKSTTSLYNKSYSTTTQFNKSYSSDRNNNNSNSNTLNKSYNRSLTKRRVSILTRDLSDDEGYEEILENEAREEEEELIAQEARKKFFEKKKKKKMTPTAPNGKNTNNNASSLARGGTSTSIRRGGGTTARAGGTAGDGLNALIKLQQATGKTGNDNIFGQSTTSVFSAGAPGQSVTSRPFTAGNNNNINPANMSTTTATPPNRGRRMTTISFAPHVENSEDEEALLMLQRKQSVLSQDQRDALAMSRSKKKLEGSSVWNKDLPRFPSFASSFKSIRESGGKKNNSKENSFVDRLLSYHELQLAASAAAIWLGKVQMKKLLGELKKKNKNKTTASSSHNHENSLLIDESTLPHLRVLDLSSETVLRCIPRLFRTRGVIDDDEANAAAEGKSGTKLTGAAALLNRSNKNNNNNSPLRGGGRNVHLRNALKKSNAVGAISSPTRQD